MSIIYIHGFNSIGPHSAKYAELTKGLPDIVVHAPTYPSNDPDMAIRTLSNFIETHNDEELMLIGTSLGGYYAQYLGRKYGTKIVLINPALSPLDAVEKHLGENTNFYTGEKYVVTTDTLSALAQYDVKDYTHEFGTLVLLDADDEIINYRTASMRYADCADVITYAGGNHRFAHMEQALPEIESYYHSVWG